MPDIFRFKEFEVDQTGCAMKINTDGVLLGALAEAEQPKTILDIGTGTGLLSLMLAQKTTATIDAVELNKAATEQATENVNNSPWKERITVINKSIQEYTTTKRYDLVISNPPFYENSLKSPEANRNTAIHAETLSLTELADSISLLLDKKGALALLLPPYESSLFSKLMEVKGFYLNELITVKDNTEGKVIREISFYSYANKQATISEIIIKDQTNNYSPKFTALLKDYYLYI